FAQLVDRGRGPGKFGRGDDLPAIEQADVSAGREIGENLAHVAFAGEAGGKAGDFALTGVAEAALAPAIVVLDPAIVEEHDGKVERAVVIQAAGYVAGFHREDDFAGSGIVSQRERVV